MSSGADSNETTLEAADRALLLQIARRAIEASLGAPGAGAPPPRPALERKAGAFVTLRRRADDELRGCVGFIEPLHSLRETVARAAASAAIHDARFEPVTLSELRGLAIDVSVLSPLAPIHAEDVVVGRHGLVVERLGKRGLLLPQVPVEWGWDRLAFLDQTCEKAGLPAGSWRDRETQLFAFTAQVFGEEAAAD